jgi:hypothetical protein
VGNENLPGQAAACTFDNRFSSTGWAVPQSFRYITFPLQASYLSATSHTGRKSCRVKSLYMKRFWVWQPYASVGYTPGYPPNQGQRIWRQVADYLNTCCCPIACYCQICLLRYSSPWSGWDYDCSWLPSCFTGTTSRQIKLPHLYHCGRDNRCSNGNCKAVTVCRWHHHSLFIENSPPIGGWLPILHFFVSFAPYGHTEQDERVCASWTN